MKFEAEINAHNLSKIETAPRYLGTLSGDDLQKLMIKVGGVCVLFGRSGGFKGFNLTINVRDMN